MPLIDRLCQYCHAPFTVHAYKSREGKGKYCSRRCFDAARARLPLIHCTACGTEFRRQPNPKNRYCSRDCRDSLMAKEAKFWSMARRCEHLPMCPFCCWEWQGTLNKDGYGWCVKSRTIGVPTTFFAHRRAWEFWNARPVPDGLLICHMCHERRCINPLHLRTGTPQDNIAESVNVLRHAFGSRNGTSKLTEQDIPQIHQRAQHGETGQALARAFGVSETAIYNILHGKVWKHVPLP